jgi:hypothetical protein
METTSLKNEKKLFDFKDSRISISEFEKVITNLNKKSIKEALNSVSEITNRNYLDFPEISRILRTIIPLMKKTKSYSDEELNNYIFSFKEIFNNQYKPESVPKIASILKGISLSHSIDFLENCLLYFQDSKVNRISLFEVAISLSDLYNRNKEFDCAFKTLNRASFFINCPTDQFEYLWKLKILNEKYADICFNEKNPKYDFYLNYYLIAFALDIARDLTAFPHLYPFYFRKKNQYSLNDDENIDIALEQLHMIKYKNQIFLEYNNFIYNELLIIYGIPIKYSEDSIRKIFDNMTTNYEEFSELMEFSEKLKKKSLDIISYKTNEFVSGLLKRFYDLGNQGSNQIS